MLDPAKNQLLTQRRPRHADGRSAAPLLDAHRRARASSTSESIKPVRLMGEDLTLYKDLSGTFGLVDRHCPHRCADMSYGFVEQCGLRCNYHGWLFDRDGRCVEQPYEDVAQPEARFRDKIRIKAYPVESAAV